MSGSLIVLAALAASCSAAPSDQPRPRLLPHEEEMKRLTEEAEKNYNSIAGGLAQLLEECKAAQEKGISLGNRLAILRRAVRLADKGYFLEQAITERFELAYRCCPSIPLRGAYYGGRHDNAYRKRGDYRMRFYLEFLTHRWPGEPENTTCLNYRCFKAVALFCMPDHPERFLTVVGHFESFLTDAAPCYLPWSLWSLR